MPRAYTKEHFKYFETLCEGIGSTPQLAQHFLEVEIANKLKWIKGNAEFFHEDIYEDSDSVSFENFYVAKCKIRFTDNRHNYSDGEKSPQNEDKNNGN